MNQRKYNSNLFFHLPLILFFVLGTAYFYVWAEHIFFYQEKSTLFLISFDYLKEHLTQPGGFLIWLGELQTTFYYYPLVGAITVSLQVCGVIYLINRISENRLSLLPYLIGAVLLFLQSNYQFLAFNSLGIFIALTFFFVTLKLNIRFLWIPAVLSPVIYFLLGSFSFIFLLLYFILLMQNKEWQKLALAVTLCLAFFFIGENYLFYQTTNSLILYPFEIKSIGDQLNLFVATIAIICLVPLVGQIDWKKLNTIRVKNVNLVELSPLLILVGLSLVLAKSFEKKDQHYFEAEKLFYAQKYEELITLNTKSPSTNMLTLFLNNSALAETGQLSGAFLNFPQSPDGKTLFLKWQIISEVLKRGGHYYYSIGMVNEAQRWAYEYMVMNGYTPEAIKMMIKTDLIKGKYDIAEKYISILEKSFFYQKDALAFRDLLNNDEAVLAHRELGPKKLLDTNNDFFVQAENPPANLEPVISSDSINIPAIEYKLAWLMLKKDMEGVVNMLPVMEKAGYNRIPKNVEEVVVAYKLMRVGKMPELKRLKVQRSTEQQFQQFYKLFQQNQGNKKLAQKALREFSNTYWYYVFFS